MESTAPTSRGWTLLGYLWVVPAILCLLFILTRASIVPYWDQFAIGQFLATSFERGYPSWSELFAQHNESRKFFPRLIFWLLALPGCWDVRREMVAHWLLLVLGGSLITSLSRRTLPPVPAAVVGVVGGTLLFSISQWQNLLWGIQIITSVPTVGLLFGVWVLTGVSERLSPGRYVLRLTLAIAAATVATYSYANGMALWVLLVPVVLLAPAPSSRWRWGGVAVLLLTAAAALLAYFATYSRPGSHPPMDVIGHFPGAAVQYFLAFLGNGLRVQANSDTAKAIGAVLLGLGLLATLVIYAAAAKDRSLDPLRRGLPWLTLIAYAILSAAATTAGRLAFGVQTAISERYVTFALPLAMAVLPAVYLACRYVWPARVQIATLALAAGCGSVLTLHVLATTLALQQSRDFAEARRQALAAAIWIDVAPNGPEAQTLLFPVPNEARAILQRLYSHGLLPFPLAQSERASAYRSATTVERSIGHLDHISRDGQSLTLSGWAVSPADTRSPADGVLLAVVLPDGDARLIAMTARTSLLRPDVPRNIGHRYTATGGWHLTVDLAHTPIPDGSQLSLWVYQRATHSLHPLSTSPFPLPPE